MENDYLEKTREKLITSIDKRDLLKALISAERIFRYYNDKNAIDMELYSIDMYNVGTAFMECSKCERAISVLRLAERNEKKKNNSMLLADIYNNIGVSCSILERLDDAIDSYEKACEVLKNLNSESSESYIDALCNTGSAYFDLKDYEKAASYHLEALGKRNKKDMDYSDNLNMLGYDFEEMGKAENAIEYFEEALKLVKKLSGINSRQYTVNLYYIANVYNRFEQYDKAILAYEQALEKIRHIMGEHHIHYAQTMIKLADICLKTDNNQRALILKLKALGVIKEVVGENHVYYIKCLKDIGNIYKLNDENDKAAVYYERALSLYREISGEKSDTYIKEALKIVDFYFDLTWYDKALELAQDIMEAADKSSSEYIDCLMSIVKIYIKTEETEKLYFLYDQVKEVLSDISFDDMLSLAQKSTSN